MKKRPGNYGLKNLGAEDIFRFVSKRNNAHRVKDILSPMGSSAPKSHNAPNRKRKSCQ
jgi:hypothetical protein